MPMNRLARAALLLTGLSLPLLPLAAQHAHHHQAADPIAAAIAAPSRTPANVARDAYRHPAETLAFFGVQPNQTVVEYAPSGRSEEHTSELQSLLRISYAVFCLNKKKQEKLQQHY